MRRKIKCHNLLRLHMPQDVHQMKKLAAPRNQTFQISVKDLKSRASHKSIKTSTTMVQLVKSQTLIKYSKTIHAQKKEHTNIKITSMIKMKILMLLISSKRRDKLREMNKRSHRDIHSNSTEQIIIKFLCNFINYK